MATLEPELEHYTRDGWLIGTIEVDVRKKPLACEACCKRLVTIVALWSPDRAGSLTSDAKGLCRACVNKALSKWWPHLGYTGGKTYLAHIPLDGRPWEKFRKAVK